ncbi:MAG TPA: nucleotidyltransferase domain-containing protein [Longimicrobium sp.]|jgi:predicted nucleotidyltransferase
MSAKAMLLGSETLYRVILYFLLHPRARPHFRALQRHVGAGVRPLKAALDRLEELDLLRSEGEGNRRVYHANHEHRGWLALMHMVREFTDPTEVLREALSDVPNVEAAFIFGSVASGDARLESDLDLFVIGEEIPDYEMGRCTSESSAVLGRVVNVVEYSRRDLARRIEENHYFVRNVLSKPKRWIVGDEKLLARMAA